MTREISNSESVASFGRSALLREQFKILSQQIPLMYALMFVNASFVSFATYRTVSFAEGFGLPALLFVAAGIRSVLWLKGRTRELEEKEIERRLTTTILLSSLLSLGFGGWGLLLFQHADLVQRTCIGLYIFIGAITCAYCLQSLPTAARAVLLFGSSPMAVRMLISEDLFLVGLGVNIVFVSIFLLRMISTNYAGFVEVLSSRSKIIEERERAREAEGRAHQMAYHDPLTGLLNRRALVENVERVVAVKPGKTGRAALLIIDLDRFKSVNDVYGHPSGDKLLRDVAERLSALVGEGGLVFRLGGDEFAVLLLTKDAEIDRPRRVARQIIQRMSEPFNVGELTHHIGASVGISLFPEDAHDRETLMRRADVALYRAKKGGRSQHSSFEPRMDAEIKRRSEIEGDLRASLLADVLRPFYQPVIDLETGQPLGFELLARWPQEGDVELGPDEFIPIAEESGLINQLMFQLLDRACADLVTWPSHLKMAVNVSPGQLTDPWLCQKILACLSRRGVAPERLTVEITENALITETESAFRVIEALKENGITIALDDFGTGYSSLQHLRILPFDEIKIDRGFIGAMSSDPEALKIVRAIIRLGSSLDMQVVAEGIESEETAECLRTLGCDQGQGYYFGRPMSGADVAQFVRSSDTNVRVISAPRVSSRT